MIDSTVDFYDKSKELDSAIESEKALYLIEKMLEDYPVESYEELTKEELVNIATQSWNLSHNFNRFNICYDVHEPERKDKLEQFNAFKKDEQEKMKEAFINYSIRVLGGNNNDKQ